MSGWYMTKGEPAAFFRRGLSERDLVLYFLFDIGESFFVIDLDEKEEMCFKSAQLCECC